MKDHPNPQVTIPMSLFGELLFRENHARLGRFVHYWCHAVWKNDPKWLVFQEDNRDDVLEIAKFTGFVVGKPGSYRHTGPNKDRRWLIGSRKSVATYVIDSPDQGLVKIGRSKDPKKRLEQLQTANGSGLRLFAVFEGDIEAELHAKFSAYRAKGEWFKRDESLLKEVRSMLGFNI